MIKIYSLPTCGKCKIIKKKITNKNISFEDCQDTTIMKTLGITSTPVLQLEDGSLIRDIEEINNYVNSL